MSDFLDNLVTRSFQPSMAIQPLSASVLPPIAPMMNTPWEFAPADERAEDPFAPPPTNGQIVEEANQLESPRARSARGSAQTVSAIVEGQQLSSSTNFQTPELVRPQGTAEPIVEQITASSRPRQTVEAKAPEQDQIVANIETDPAPVEASRRLVTRRAESAGLGAGPILSALQSQPAQSAQPAIQPPMAPNVAIQPAMRRENGIAPDQKQTSLVVHNHSPAPQPRVERVIIERVMEVVEKTEAVADARLTLTPKPIGKPPLAPNISARSKPRPWTAPNAAAPEPAPPETVVNITIGRIEVRATPPPTKPERQRSAPPVMGLDDYLRQRNGGNR